MIFHRYNKSVDDNKDKLHINCIGVLWINCIRDLKEMSVDQLFNILWIVAKSFLFGMCITKNWKIVHKIKWHSMKRHVTETTPCSVGQNNFSLLCFWTTSFHAESHIHIRQHEKLEYFLLNFLQKRRLTPTFADSPCLLLPGVTNAPGSQENMKITTFSAKWEFLFSANRMWNCANTVIYIVQ